MKRVLSIIIIAALALPLFAGGKSDSTKVTKDYSQILPQAGDWSVGVTLNPLVNFVGNMFNGTIGQVLDDKRIGGGVLQIGNNPTYPLVSVMGKYMITDHFGIRANVGFLMNYADSTKYVVDDLSSTTEELVPNMVKDRKISNTFGGSFSVGAEYRVGKKAVQGVFSGGLMYSLSKYTCDYTYGNAITEINQKPTSAFHPALIGEDKAGMGNYRILRESTACSHTMGLVCSAGFEWFVAPKVALGAEVNLALLYQLTPGVLQQVEGYLPLVEDVKKATIMVGEVYQGFVFGTQNIGANFFMNFYF